MSTPVAFAPCAFRCAFSEADSVRAPTPEPASRKVRGRHRNAVPGVSGLAITARAHRRYQESPHSWGSRNVFRQPMQLRRWLQSLLPKEHAVVHASSRTRRSDELKASRMRAGSERGEERKIWSIESSLSRLSSSIARPTPKGPRRSTGSSRPGGVTSCSPSSVELGDRSRTTRACSCGPSARSPVSSTSLFTLRRPSRRPRLAWQ